MRWFTVLYFIFVALIVALSTAVEKQYNIPHDNSYGVTFDVMSLTVANLAHCAKLCKQGGLSRENRACIDLVDRHIMFLQQRPTKYEKIIKETTVGTYFSAQETADNLQFVEETIEKLVRTTTN